MRLRPRPSPFDAAATRPFHAPGHRGGMTVAPESTPTVTVRRCEDLLALIPHQLGHSPCDGTVLFLPVRDGHALCLSLDTPDSRADLPAVAEDLAGLLAGTPHRGELVVVVYCATGQGTR